MERFIINKFQLEQFAKAYAIYLRDNDISPIFTWGRYQHICFQEYKHEIENQNYIEAVYNQIEPITELYNLEFPQYAEQNQNEMNCLTLMCDAKITRVEIKPDYTVIPMNFSLNPFQHTSSEKIIHVDTEVSNGNITTTSKLNKYQNYVLAFALLGLPQTWYILMEHRTLCTRRNGYDITEYKYSPVREREEFTHYYRFRGTNSI